MKQTIKSVPTNEIKKISKTKLKMKTNLNLCDFWSSGGARQRTDNGSLIINLNYRINTLHRRSFLSPPPSWFAQRQVANGYRCGVCGDPYDAADKPNEAGGLYATGQISRAYRQASDVRITVWITANHRGQCEL